jgi:hypothetical protein
MIWTFQIPIATPSANTFLRQHFRTRAIEKEALGWMLANSLNKQPKIPSATSKRRLTIERHGKRALDADNLAGGCKSLIDCIKERRLILDDNPADCELIFRQVVSTKAAVFTLITLEDLP